MVEAPKRKWACVCYNSLGAVHRKTLTFGLLGFPHLSFADIFEFLTEGGEYWGKIIEIDLLKRENIPTLTALYKEEEGD